MTQRPLGHRKSDPPLFFSPTDPLQRWPRVVTNASESPKCRTPNLVFGGSAPLSQRAVDRAKEMYTQTEAD